MSHERIIEHKKLVVRHSLVELIEHWVLAISGFVLLFSGFGQMPIYKRYWIAKLPGFQWSGDYRISLMVHYVAAAFFIGVAIFHVLYHGLLGHRGLLPKRGDVRASCTMLKAIVTGCEEPACEKYLPEQRLAYAYFAALIFALIVTGLIKVCKNFPGAYISPATAFYVTWIHTMATILFLVGIVAHLGAFVFKSNRPMLRGIFTGKVDLDYVCRRHSIWYEILHLRHKGTPSPKEEPAKTQEEER